MPTESAVAAGGLGLLLLAGKTADKDLGSMLPGIPAPLLSVAPQRNQPPVGIVTPLQQPLLRTNTTRPLLVSPGPTLSQLQPQALGGSTVVAPNLFSFPLLAPSAGTTHGNPVVAMKSSSQSGPLAGSAPVSSISGTMATSGVAIIPPPIVISSAVSGDRHLPGGINLADTKPLPQKPQVSMSCQVLTNCCMYSAPCDLRPLYLTIPCILRLDISDTTCIFSV